MTSSPQLRDPAPTAGIPKPGLRERKKARTRAAIRDQAMRLFDEQGYAATTVDQIAEAAEVSQSTFFRYFPTKEDVVLADDFDPLIAAAIRAQPAGMHPIDAITAGMQVVFGQMTAADIAGERRRQRLFQQVPELQARAMQQLADVIDLLAQVAAERAGLAPDDFSAKVLAGAVVGAVMAVARPGDSHGLEASSLERIVAALRLLRQGLPLG